MTPCLCGGRLRRAAALTLFLGAIIGQPASNLAEQISDHNFATSGETMSDGTVPSFGTAPDGLTGNWPSGRCDAYCTDCGEGNSNPGFDDGYRHYCPVW